MYAYFFSSEFAKNFLHTQTLITLTQVPIPADSSRDRLHSKCDGGREARVLGGRFCGRDTPIARPPSPTIACGGDTASPPITHHHPQDFLSKPIDVHKLAKLLSELRTPR